MLVERVRDQQDSNDGTMKSTLCTGRNVVWVQYTTVWAVLSSWVWMH
jgi:hypothetical protein